MESKHPERDYSQILFMFDLLPPEWQDFWIARARRDAAEAKKKADPTALHIAGGNGTGPTQPPAERPALRIVKAGQQP